MSRIASRTWPWRARSACASTRSLRSATTFMPRTWRAASSRCCARRRCATVPTTSRKAAPRRSASWWNGRRRRRPGFTPRSAADAQADILQDASLRDGMWGAYDISRIATETGWQPRPVREALHAYMDWIEAQRARHDASPDTYPRDLRRLRPAPARPALAGRRADRRLDRAQLRGRRRVLRAARRRSFGVGADRRRRRARCRMRAI